ncbi:ubiquitin-protein ligase E3A-like [Anneissia japonica]|uniref:ubiquitin-protein ligase E3A-like n=1 Tax=Anneissia japonica TaxID=1529436 RepID=UPI001425BAA9|nr:ubiquitin-protein ligase E3A-like [Anneissia japonica]
MSEGGTFVVPGKPPPRPVGRKVSRLAEKRGSLPASIINADISRLKLGRHQSQPKLSRDEGGGSLSNLLIQRGRSNSITQLDSFKKTLSASNLAALSDSNLSITKALPFKSYDKPNTASSIIKDYWQQLVKRYFFQITEGCGNEHCKNKFCASSKDCLHVLNKGNAVIISIQLAAHQKQYICISEKLIGRCLPKDALQPEEDQPTPFLYSLYSCTPFASLFVDKGEPESLSCEDWPDTSIKASSFDNIMSTSKKKDYKTIGQQNCMRVSQSLADSEQLVSRKYCVSQYSSTVKNDESRLNQLRSLSIDLSKVGGGAIANVQSAVGSDHRHHSYNSLPALRSVSGSLLSAGSCHNSSSNSGLSLHSHSSVNSHSLSNTLPFTPSPIPSHEALTETDDLVAFERSLSREMSLETPSEFSLTHLTLEMLKAPVDHYKQCSDPSFLINTIRTVFTSSDALNSSFLLKEDDICSGVDLEAVDRAYDLLLNLYPPDVFQSTMNNSLEILMSSIHPASIQSSEINQFQILLASPLFVGSHELLRKLCAILGALCKSAKRAIVRVLSCYDKKTFQKLIAMFNVHLSATLHPQQGSEGNLIDAAKVLQILYDANTHSGKTLAAREQFYSDDLSRKLDYKTEYSKWRLSQEADSTRNPTSAAANQFTSLLNFPFLFDPASKVQVLHFDAVLQMRQEYQSAILHQARVNQAQKYIREGSRFNKISDCVKSAICPFLVLDIRRDHLIPDTLAQIRIKQSDLKKPLKIKYIGGGEQGLDMGGLQKEFFQLLTGSIFEPSYGMFLEAEETRLLWINGGSLESDDEFELVGTILGLAIYNGIILDVHFPNLIYKKLHGEKLSLDDLKEVQPTIARSLQDLLDYEGDVEETFCQTFQISLNCFSEVFTVDLIPNGSQVFVTNKNRQNYVDCYVKYILTDSVAKQFEAFSRGFHLVCGGPALKLFQAEETELLVCGNPELDFKALEACTTYEDGFTRYHRTIKAFWSVVHSLNQNQKKKLLNFITGSDRVPVKGLSSLPIVIQRHGPDSDRLPTAMTCFNRLLLPSYSSKEKLRNRITIALENGKGFGLT